MSKDLKKLAAEMQKMKPSTSSRKGGMEAAMAAFSAEFAPDNMEAAQAVKTTPSENNSQSPQGLNDAARPTGQTIRTRRVDTSRSDVMSKFKSAFPFNAKATMMMGSCAAALMFAAVIVPAVRPELMELPPQASTSEPIEAVEPLLVEPPKVDTAEAKTPLSRPAPEIAADKAAENNNIASVGDLLDKARTKAAHGAETIPQTPPPAPVRNPITSLEGAVPQFEAPFGAKQSAPKTSPAPQIERQQALAGRQSFKISGGRDRNAPAQAAAPKTETVTRRVLKTPARTVERNVPAVTKMETRRVLQPDGSYITTAEPVVVQEAGTELITIPPTFETITETIVVQPDRSEFEKFITNPVIAAADTPVSTFSIDVDTASYSFFRSSINGGQLPPASSVRVEEMINYFPYDYDAPRSADEPFKANVTVTPTPWNADTKLMRIGIKGYVPPATERPDSNIVLLIDTSGSMNQPNKLPLLINSFKLLLNTLGEDDTVSIVTYAGSAGTVLEPTAATDKRKIIAALNNLRAGGSTAGAAGLELAYNKALESFDKDGTNRVILATDGDFNIGFSSPEEMKSFITEKRKTGIFLSVLGFGRGNYKDDLMQSLAQNGNGTAAYIDTLAEANKVLADESGSVLTTIAKDVKIQVEFNPDTIAEYRLIGYETRALKREDFNNDAVDAGEIGAGHSVTALYELTPVGSPARVIDDLRYVKDAKPQSSGSDELAFVKIRHKLPNADTSTLQTFPVGPRAERDLKRASDDMRFAAAVAAAGQKLRGDTQLANYSYADVIELAASGKGKDKHGYRSEFIQLLRLVETMDTSAMDAKPSVQVDPRRRR